MNKVASNKPDVVVVFGLKDNGDGWEVDWKASHWLEDEGLPPGVQGAIVKEMLKDGIGDKLGDMVINKGLPALAQAISERIRK